MVAIILCSSLCLYAVGVARLWRHAGAGQGIRYAQALAFNRGLRWCGPIVRLARHGDEVVARFWLRTRGHCERGGGERGSVAFTVRDGKIVFFDQIGA